MMSNSTFGIPETQFIESDSLFCKSYLYMCSFCRIFYDDIQVREVFESIARKIVSIKQKLK
jgi:hypothetical protein